MQETNGFCGQSSTPHISNCSERNVLREPTTGERVDEPQKVSLPERVFIYSRTQRKLKMRSQTADLNDAHIQYKCTHCA
ncbi:uncharacterized [Tachysurus ichikawai]